MEIPRVYLVLCFYIASLLLQKVGRLSAKGTLRRDRCIISRFRFFREIIGYKYKNMTMKVIFLYLVGREGLEPPTSSV